MVDLNIDREELGRGDWFSGVQTVAPLLPPQEHAIDEVARRREAVLADQVGSPFASGFALSHLDRVFGALAGSALDLAQQFHMDCSGLAVLADDRVDDLANLVQGLLDQRVEDVRRRRRKGIEEVDGPLVGAQVACLCQSAGRPIARHHQASLLQCGKELDDRLATDVEIAGNDRGQVDVRQFAGLFLRAAPVANGFLQNDRLFIVQQTSHDRSAFVVGTLGPALAKQILMREGMVHRRTEELLPPADFQIERIAIQKIEVLPQLIERGFLRPGEILDELGPLLGSEWTWIGPGGTNLQVVDLIQQPEPLGESVSLLATLLALLQFTASDGRGGPVQGPLKEEDAVKPDFLKERSTVSTLPRLWLQGVGLLSSGSIPQ